MLKQAHLFVKGDLIGVRIRAWTKIQDKMLGVFGWVRNVYDNTDVFGPFGGVETVIQADEKILLLMIDKLRQGSPVSIVTYVEIIWEDPKEIFDEFKIIH